MRHRSGVRIRGAEIRRRRQLELGLHQTTLAKRAGISSQYWSLIELGLRPTVSPPIYRAICDAMGVEDRSELLDSEVECSTAAVS